MLWQLFFNMILLVLQFGPPAAIYAARPKHKDSSQRSIQTVTPLAQQLHQKVLTPCLTSDVDDLAELILEQPEYDNKMVLICWEHKMMSPLTAAFGVSPPLPKYPGDRFDLIYMIQFTDQAPPTFCLALQELMFDDSSTPPDGFPVCPG